MDKTVESLFGNTTFLVGNKKNAGKTTFLNYILKQVRLKTSPAFLTIGIDGEKKDLIFSTPKPQIYTEAGDYIITSDTMILRSEALFEIHQVFPYKTVLGRLLLAKTIRGGYIELVGSEDNKQLSEIIDFLRNEKKLSTIIVDGAANRTTQVATAKNGSFIYIIKVDQNNLNSTLEKMKTISFIKKFPRAEKEITAHKDTFFLKGALTQNKTTLIPEKCNKLIIEDFTKIFLTYQQITKLSKRMKIYYKNPYQLNAFTVNLMNIKADEFELLLKQNGIDDKIIYNPYQFHN